LMEVVTRLPCHSRMAGMTSPWVLKLPGGAEGQDRVALLDSQVEATQEAVSDAVAAAEDDPAPPWPQDQEAAQLPPAGPLRAPLAPAPAGPRRQEPDQQAIEGKLGSRR
jgi:hypothetical protein